MNSFQEIADLIEIHSVTGIRECFSKGMSPNAVFNEKPLFETMTEMYMRSPRFKDCVRTFVDFGLKFEDRVLLSVLMDDAGTLENYLRSNPGLISEKRSLTCTYTPLEEVSLLHICAEFNHLSCAEVLVKFGADVNERAGADQYGFGGQTPVFHTVNQNHNNSQEMLNFLLAKSADLHLTLKGIIWGKGFEWETLIPAVNPVSYAMMGMLPQMHRQEITISKVVTKLLKHAYGIDYQPKNIPCAYLKS